jgi:short-subunit dehydrogenase
MDLQNAWVLVTGASRGIGVAIAEEFGASKANLILVARSAEGLRRTCDRVEERGGKPHPIPFDLEDTSRIADLVEEIRRIAPHADVLVNNAGLEKYCFFSECRREDIVSILSVNLIAPMELTRLLLPDMLERSQGHIINVSSLSGKIGEVYNSLYSTSKGGMELWTDALRQELYETGVRVSAVAPGGVTDSGMIHNIGVPYPAIIGSCTAKDVAKAVVRCTAEDHARLFVNSLPVRPLVLLGLIAPRFFDALLRRIGLPRRNKEKVYRRMRLDQDVSDRNSAY